MRRGKDSRGGGGFGLMYVGGGIDVRLGVPDAAEYREAAWLGAVCEHAELL